MKGLAARLKVKFRRHPSEILLHFTYIGILHRDFNINKLTRGWDGRGGRMLENLHGTCRVLCLGDGCSRREGLKQHEALGRHLRGFPFGARILSSFLGLVPNLVPNFDNVERVCRGETLTNCAFTTAAHLSRLSLLQRNDNGPQPALYGLRYSFRLLPHTRSLRPFLLTCLFPLCALLGDLPVTILVTIRPRPTLPSKASS